MVAGLTRHHCTGSMCCRWRQGFGQPAQDGAKTPGAKGQGPAEHTCLVLQRHEQPSPSSQPQQHSAVETVSTIAAQPRGNPLGRASLVATPVCPKQQQPVGQQTSSRQALQPTNTRTRCKQRWEHPVPGLLGGREVSKAEGQEKRRGCSATMQDLGFLCFTQTSSSCRCRAASMQKLGETT